MGARPNEQVARPNKHKPQNTSQKAKSEYSRLLKIGAIRYGMVQ